MNVAGGEVSIPGAQERLCSNAPIGVELGVISNDVRALAMSANPVRQRDRARRRPYAQPSLFVCDERALVVPSKRDRSDGRCVEPHGKGRPPNCDAVSTLSTPRDQPIPRGRKRRTAKLAHARRERDRSMGGCILDLAWLG